MNFSNKENEMTKFKETTYVLVKEDGTAYRAPWVTNKNAISTFATRREARYEKNEAKYFDGINLKIAKAKATYNVEQFVR